MSLRPGCMVRTICGQLRTSCVRLGSFGLLPPHSPLPHPFPPPTHPSTAFARTRPLLFSRTKLSNLLNKIQFTFEVVPCLILSLFRRFFQRCASISAQSYQGRCFSNNYYQVRTWSVFAETITNWISVLVTI